MKTEFFTAPKDICQKKYGVLPNTIHDIKTQGSCQNKKTINTVVRFLAKLQAKMRSILAIDTYNGE